MFALTQSAAIAPARVQVIRQSYLVTSSSHRLSRKSSSWKKTPLKQNSRPVELRVDV